LSGNKGDAEVDAVLAALPTIPFRKIVSTWLSVTPALRAVP
jgi:hypothetical protein